MPDDAQPATPAGDGPPGTDAGYSARLTIPAATRFLRLARLTAAGLAGDLGFRVDAVEDLRVAVDELSALAIEGANAGAHLELVYREHGTSLVIDGSCPTEDSAPPELHRVARELLEIVADEYSFEVVDHCRRFRLLKHADSTSV